MRNILNIRLLGKEVGYFTDVFSEHAVEVLTSHEEVEKDVHFVFCLSYPKIIPEPWLQVPKVGFFINHSSDLPEGRGWAPLQWSVLKGLKQVTATFFRAEPGVDSGNWCYKESYPIWRSDTIEDLYLRDRELTRHFMKRVVEEYLSGSLQFYPQQGAVEYWRRRYPEDSKVDMNQPLAVIWDQLRICDNNAYPAFFVSEGSTVVIKLLPLSRATTAPELDSLGGRTLREVWTQSQERQFLFQVDGRSFMLEFKTK